MRGCVSSGSAPGRYLFCPSVGFGRRSEPNAPFVSIFDDSTLARRSLEFLGADVAAEVFGFELDLVAKSVGFGGRFA